MSLSSMRLHVESMHMHLHRYECKECDAKFRQSDTLARHMCDAHGAPRFPCADCGRYFDTKSALTCHRTSHVRSVCPTCGKAFSGGRALLLRHIKAIHLRVKDKACSRCDEKFLSTSALYRHEYHVHGLRGELHSFPPHA
jgi:uncharacterized Zn-finger protein